MHPDVLFSYSFDRDKNEGQITISRYRGTRFLWLVFTMWFGLWFRGWKTARMTVPVLP